MVSIRRTAVVSLLACSMAVALGQKSTGPVHLRRHAVAIWNFNEGKGTTLKDSSGNGHHGTIVGARWVKDGAVSALRFVRDERNYVNVPDSPGLHVQPPYTLGVWIKTTSPRNNAVYLIGSSNTHGCGLYFYGDSMSLYHDAKGTDKKLYHKGNSSKTLPDGTWHHVVGTCGDGKLRLFLNGQVLAERDVPKDLRLNYTGSPDLGLGHWGGAGYLDGEMGKAYILKKALSKQQIKALFEAERKTYNSDVTINKTAKAPIIDGKLTDACWENQPALGNFTVNNYESIPARKQTRAYLCYDNKNIYLGVRCEEPNISGISAKKRPRDDKDLRTDDTVQVFISPGAGPYYRFLINAVNALGDARYEYKIEDSYVKGAVRLFKSNVGWSCAGFKSAVHKGKDYWSTEMSIPFSQIGGTSKPGHSWSLNIARDEKQQKEQSTFSPLFGSFHQPEVFSRLSFLKDKAVLARAKKEFVVFDMTPGAKEAPKADKGPDPVVFVHNYLERGCPTTLPKKGELTNRLELFAAQGEYEPVTFSVRAGTKPVKGVNVRVADDLKNDKDGIIPKKNVEIRVVERWKRRLTSRKIMYMERYLFKKRTVDIPRHTTQRFWLTVHVPEDAQAGIYQGRIGITSGKTSLKTLKLKVKVLPFKLQPAEGMAYFMFYPPKWGLPKNLHTQEYQRKCIMDMKAHGMTAFTLYSYPYAVVDGKRQFTMEVDGEQNDLAFGPTIDTLLETGMLQPGMPVMWLGADALGAGDWKRVLDEAKKRNWPELVFYIVDEPGSEERNEKARRLFRQLDKFKERYPEYKGVRATTSLATDGAEAVGHLYDIWITGAGSGGRHRTKEFVEKGKEMGKEIWSYHCAVGNTNAEFSRYNYGLWVWKAGIKGAANWAYSFAANPSGIMDWDYIDQHLQDMEMRTCFVYPSVEEPVPSIGWEGIREGIDDYRYIRMLTKLIEQARAAGREELAQGAEKTLKEIKGKIRIEALGKAVRAGDTSGRRSGYAFDKPSPQSNISKEDYNKFRYEIACEIIKLRKLMEK